MLEEVINMVDAIIVLGIIMASIIVPISTIAMLKASPSNGRFK